METRFRQRMEHAGSMNPATNPRKRTASVLDRALAREGGQVRIRATDRERAPDEEWRDSSMLHDGPRKATATSAS
jgi:hypothetical protein